MLKKTITYQDFNGDTATEEHFFHLSKADLVELELSYEGGLSETLQRIVDAGNGSEIIKEFKKLLLLSYGKRSSDGRRFTKSQELRDEFQSTEAFSTLFVDLVTDAEAAAAFVAGIIPAGFEEEISKIGKTAAEVNTKPDHPKPGPRVLTHAEILAMDVTELKIKLASGDVILGNDDQA